MQNQNSSATLVQQAPHLCCRSEWHISASCPCAHNGIFTGGGSCYHVHVVAVLVQFRDRWEVSLQETWSLGKWSVTKFIVMICFRTKSASKPLLKNKLKTKSVWLLLIPRQEISLIMKNTGNDWQHLMLSIWSVGCWFLVCTIHLEASQCSCWRRYRFDCK